MIASRAAISNFADCLPSGVRNWVLIRDRHYQAALAPSLSSALPIIETIVLGHDTPQRVRSIAEQHLNDPDVGLLEFLCCDGARTRGGHDYQTALMRFAHWPPERVRLCFDVTDSNFDELFSEPARRIKARSQVLRRRLKDEGSLAFRAGTSRVTIRCPRHGWHIHSGLEIDDYLLPSGEIECVPDSVDGDLDVDGWIVGTIPFGIKYGRIGSSQLKLRFRHGEVVDVSGSNRSLCGELETAFTALPGMRRAVEMGIGQSKAVSRAASKEQVGCLWHERHFGMHLGLGAELRETAGRVTQHHLDLVLAAGTLVGAEGRAILRW